MNDESPGLGLDLPEEPQAAGSPYRVLARKYRPQTFDQLIGQDAVVPVTCRLLLFGEVEAEAGLFVLFG